MPNYNDLIPEDVYDRIKLVETCCACPEQYDMYFDGIEVGYFRLRHGSFTVDDTSSGDIEVYSAEPEGDGIFDSDERDFYLTMGMIAVLKSIGEINVGGAIPHHPREIRNSKMLEDKPTIDF